MLDRGSALRLIALLFVLALGFSLFANLPALYRNFLFADQAVYYAMTRSIAQDGDLEYTRQDLVRYYRDIDSGPQGIFLKKVPDGRLFFAKSWAYPLFAAPFVRIFGMNGFPVFHSVLLLLLLLMGYAYLSLTETPGLSLAGILTFLFASVACVYYVWISPDFFNLCLVFSVLFLWGYKARARSVPPASAESSPPPGRLRRFLLSDGSDCLAAFLAGIATFSKPPNIVLMVPLVLSALLGKRIKKSVLVVVFFLASAAVLFGVNYLLTSDWNFMGGERKTFYFGFPFQKEGMTFDTTGATMTAEGYFDRMLIPAKFIAYNLFYYVFGRFTGIAWYFFPSLVLLALFAFGRRGRDQWLLFAALAAEVLAYIVLMPTNYGGGGGSLANRYFLNIFPLFFFLPGTRPGKRPLAFAWLVAAVFIAPILVTPYQSSGSPATHAKRFPIKLLPLEMTLYNEFPTNTNPSGFRVPFGTEPTTGVAYFLDDNFHKRSEPDGTWTLGDRTLELVVKTKVPVRRIVLRLTNNPRRDNRVTATVDGRTRRVVLQPLEKADLEFDVGRGFKIEDNYLHRMKIGAAKGSLPYFEQETATDRRYLGVFFEMEFVPAQGTR